MDPLQIKIEKARAQLSQNTLRAIDAVPWQAEILKMRETKGYSFEQLGDLEIETELVLCGLLRPENYPQEIENRMKITKTQANDLVNEMNSLVFSKIKEELIKQTENKKVVFKNAKVEIGISPKLAEDQTIKKDDTQVLNKAGIELVLQKDEPNTEIQVEKREEILAKIENPGLIIPTTPAPKILVPTQTKIVKTEYSLNNLSKPENTEEISSYSKNKDPYRLSPDE